MDQYSKTSSTATDGEETGEPWDIFVKSGTKLRNIIAQSLRLLQSKKEEKITITASGPTVTKAISCAEIIKRKIKGLHQSNKLFYTKIEDTWEPKESTLDKLQVTRKIPSIKITLSRVPLDPSQPGYQSPGNSKSPVQFKDEDWELAHEDKTDKGSERSRPGQAENRAKRSKGRKDGLSRGDGRRRLQNDNVKEDSNSDNDKGARISEKEVNTEIDNNRDKRNPEKNLFISTGGVSGEHLEQVHQDINNETLKGASKECQKSKHHGASARYGHKKGNDESGYKSKQTPRKKKKAE